MSTPDNEILNAILYVKDRQEADKSYTKEIYIGKIGEDGKTGGEPDVAVLAQQQEHAGPTTQMVEAIAEAVYRLFEKDIELVQPVPEGPPEKPLIVTPSDAELKKATQR